MGGSSGGWGPWEGRTVTSCWAGEEDNNAPRTSEFLAAGAGPIRVPMVGHGK